MLSSFLPRKTSLTRLGLPRIGAISARVLAIIFYACQQPGLVAKITTNNHPAEAKRVDEALGACSDWQDIDERPAAA